MEKAKFREIIKLNFCYVLANICQINLVKAN